MKKQLNLLFSLLFICYASVSRAFVGDEEFRNTYSDEELENFCNEKISKGQQSLPMVGYSHPFYCSRYIECTTTKDEGGKLVLKAEEKICGKCARSKIQQRNGQNAQKHQLCKHGHKHWDEAMQSCKPQNKKCIQSELPKNNIWGRKDLAHLCTSRTVGKKLTYADPFHCGRYVTCFRDRDYFKDLWITSELCPSCDPTTIGCPNGHLHYSPPINDTEGYCHLTTRITEMGGKQCQPKERNHSKLEHGVGTTTPTPTELEDNIPKENANAEATKFCSKQQRTPKRYPVPGACNKYYSCYSNLYDKDGDIRSPDKIRHFLFSCDSCAGIDVEFNECNATTNGKTNYLQFDFEEQMCIIPFNGTCKEDGSFVASIDHNKNDKSDKPLMTDEEVKQLCMKNETNGNFEHPKDPTCSRYIECWAKMDLYKERICPECNHAFKGDPIKCPTGHLYFDKNSGTCEAGQRADCKPDHGPTVAPPPVIAAAHSKDIFGPTTPLPSDEFKDENTNPELSEPKPCNLKKYVQRGYCKKYFTCDRKTRIERKHDCSGRLFWNPDVNSVHGGICDYLRHIDNYTLYQYKKDPGCALSIAYFRADEQKCSGTYYYHHPKRTEGKEVKLQCPEDLLFSKEAKSCVKCHTIFMADGKTPCCDGGAAGNSDY